MQQQNNAYAQVANNATQQGMVTRISFLGSNWEMRT